jgi:hypothetical protein
LYKTGKSHAAEAILPGFLKITIAILLAFISSILILGCGKDKIHSDPDSPGEWTILIYADGNNHFDLSEFGDSKCVASIQEFEKVGSSNEINVIAMLATSNRGGLGAYYHIEYHPDDSGDTINSAIVTALGSCDMSSPITLKNFLSFGIEHYPANNYMLIIEDHGYGWPGSCLDETNGGGNIMSIPAMAGTIEQVISERQMSKFGIVMFAAPLMSMIEVAYEFRNCANYMIASENSNDVASVIGPEIWLTGLKSNIQMDPNGLAQNIVQAVYQTAVSKHQDIHIAALDLSTAVSLASLTGNLGNALLLSADQYWPEILAARRELADSEYIYPAYVDLGEFALSLRRQARLDNIPAIREAADSVLGVINDGIVLSLTNIPGLSRSGLSVHLPLERGQFDSTGYATLDFHNQSWIAFVSKLISENERGPANNLIVSVYPAGSGEITIDPILPEYYSGDSVTLRATPYGGYSYLTWTINGVDSIPNPIRLIFGSGDINATAHFVETGPHPGQISGTVIWPGHELSSHTYAFADTVGNDMLQLVSWARVNRLDSTFTLQVDNLSDTIYIFLEAHDDVNDNGYWDPIDAGDGWGFYDPNNDGIRNDSLAVWPGARVSGIRISMHLIY